MSRVVKESEESIGVAADAIRAAAVVVIPTDTVYGVAAGIDHPGAIARIFELKRRDRSKPLAILVKDLEQARTFGVFSEEALEAVERQWPGALTVVVHRSEAARELGLGGDGSTVGLRAPNHGFTLALIESVGPLVATSANLSGADIPKDIAGVSELFGERVDLYVDGGLLSDKPSTVRSFVGPEQVLRD